MKRVSISGSLRENVGKKDAKLQRVQGKVVCVLYGGENQIHFTVDQLVFDKLIFTPEVFIIDLEIDGTVYPSILKDTQYHPVSDKTLHADFMQLVDGKAVTVHLPIKLEGVAPGVTKGGNLNRKLKTIPVRGLVTDMPDNFIIDISDMQIGDTKAIRDIDFGKLTPQLAEGNLIVGVKTSRIAAAADEDDEDDDEEGGEGGETPAEGGETPAE